MSADVGSHLSNVRYGPKADVGAQISRQKIMTRPNFTLTTDTEFGEECRGKLVDRIWLR